jgi:hypothetical protein
MAPGAAIVVAALLAGPAALLAAQWIVDDDGPADFRSVQAAINAPYVVSGDAVLVRPGFYPGNVVLTGKDLAIVSERGPFVTVLDGLDSGSVVSLLDRTEATRIEGFTIRNGRDQTGGGVWIAGGAPVVTRNVIEGNSAVGGFLGYGYGGGVEIVESAATVTYNVIRGNRALDGGGGIDVYYSGPSTPGTCCPLLAHNTITGNVVTAPGGLGGGVLAFAAEPDLVDSILAGNAAPGGGGLAVVRVQGNTDQPAVEVNLFFANTPDDSGAFRLPSSNRHADPRLGQGVWIDAWPGSDSPALDAAGGAAGIADLAGRAASQDGTLDAVARPDIGALEGIGEVTGLRLAADAAGAILLAWDGSINGAVRFNVYAADGDPFRTGGGICAAAGLAAPAWTDASGPVGPGAVRYYLVTGEDVVEGGRGLRSDGTERPAASACP